MNKDYPVQRHTLNCSLFKETVCYVLTGYTYPIIFILIIHFSYKIDCHAVRCKSDSKAAEINVLNG